MTAGLDRRALLAALGLGAATISRAGSVWAMAAETAQPVAPVLVRLCDLTIPATDTPGAVGAGVPAFLQLAIAHGLEGAPPDADRSLLVALDVRTPGGKGFLSADAKAQGAVLTAVDAEVFARGGPAPKPDDLKLWAPVKALIVGGYYTSEIGGSKEELYEPVPGRLDADIKVGPDARAYSSDWTAVTFG